MQKGNKKGKTLTTNKDDLRYSSKSKKEGKHTPKKIKSLAAKKKCIQIKRLIAEKRTEVEHHTKSMKFSIIKWLKFSDHFFRTLLFTLIN